MGVEDDFCVGCGQHSLGFSLMGNSRELPCTYYDDKSRDFIIDALDHLDVEHLNAVLEFYNYEPIKDEEARP